MKTRTRKTNKKIVTVGKAMIDTECPFGVTLKTESQNIDRCAVVMMQSANNAVNALLALKEKAESIDVDECANAFLENYFLNRFEPVAREIVRQEVGAAFKTLWISLVEYFKNGRLNENVSVAHSIANVDIRRKRNK